MPIERAGTEPSRSDPRAPTAPRSRPARFASRIVAGVSILEWLVLAAGLLLVVHYAWFMDDAFVFFRYVDNLLFLGHGLVWNAGEYVEGFSSPLWTLLLVALRSSGADYWLITRLLGAGLFLVFWRLLVVLNRRLSPRGVPVVNAPLVYLAFNYGVLCYFTSGLETPLVQVSAVTYALLALSPGSRALQVFVGATPLLRPELALTYLIALGWCWRRTGRFPTALFVSGLALPGGWLVFRIYYYADLLPNTFYLKNGLDLAQGWAYLAETASTYRWPVFLAAGLVALGFLARRLRPEEGEPPPLRVRARLLMLAMALVLTAYVVKIGGDPRHFRYLAFPFCLSACACGGIAEQALARVRRAGMRRALALGLVLLLGGCTLGFYPPQLAAHPFFGPTEHVTVHKINDALQHRFSKTLRQPPWGRGVGVEFREAYAAWRRDHPDQPYSAVEAGSRCVTMFRAFHTRWVHTLGLTEPVLARMNVAAERPGHKLGLIPLGRQIRRIEAATENAPGPGMYRDALRRGLAPPWVEPNLESLELIERKEFNRHHFLENLRLALRFPHRIDPGIRLVPLPPGVHPGPRPGDGR